MKTVPLITGRAAAGTDVLTDIIRRDIQAHKVITFARFMDLALYHPDHGYYQNDDQSIGKAGDYFTSVSVGYLFGELLAFQFAEWLAQEEAEESRKNGSKGSPAETFQWVEAGAHNGRLAADILAWVRDRRPELFDRLEYSIVEPSVTRQGWQKNVLKAFEPRVRWLRQWPVRPANPQSAGFDPPSNGVRGVIFSNELLDAMPVHRLGWDGARRCWFEWGVGWERDRFVWVRMANSFRKESEMNLIPEVPPELAAVLPDGFTTEICPAANRWWREAARCLRRGRLLTFDYGLTSEEFLDPARGPGTLRAYHRHHGTTDVLARAGEQDLTAHVNFSALQSTGEAAGLTTEGFMTQSQFLTRIAAQAWNRDGRLGDWSQAERRQFQTLVHPEQLGGSFRVLAQARG